MTSRRNSRAFLQPARHSGLESSLVALVAGRPRRFAYEVPSRFSLIVSKDCRSDSRLSTASVNM